MHRQKLLFLALILCVALFLRVSLVIYHTRDKNFHLQQDNYASYAYMLKNNRLHAGILTSQDRSYTTAHSFSEVDTRLLPGYPWIIALLSFFPGTETQTGLTISILASLLAIYFFWLLTQSAYTTLIFAVLPPVWVIQGTKIATEPITVCLFLAVILLFKNKRYLFSGIILGIAFDIRTITICLLLALLLELTFKRQWKQAVILLAGFIPFALLLFGFNYIVFHGQLLYQFLVYNATGRPVFGALQIILDLKRTIDWKQYRIFVSGVTYLLLNLSALFFLFKRRNYSPLYKVLFFWMGLSLLFIFSIGPNPMLEEFARYAAPLTPALIIGLLPDKNIAKK